VSGERQLGAGAGRFGASGVPVRPAVDVSYLQRGGVQAALAWLRLAVAQDGGLAGRDLMLAARRPSRSMSPRLVSWIGERNDLKWAATNGRPDAGPGQR